MTCGKTIISITSYQRRDVLEQTLANIAAFTPSGTYRILITNNGHGDTEDMLKAKHEAGELEVFLFEENLGIAKSRNAHWHLAIGHDVVRLDDKIAIQTPYWLPILKCQAYAHHALIGLPDPDTQHLWQLADRADAVKFELWKCGAAMYIPQECVDKLGGWCEDYGVYGHEDLDYMVRAESLGYPFVYSLRVYAQHLARANPERRKSVEPYVPIYEANKVAYESGLKDIFIPLAEGRRV
mgnify:CR=1 FL=1